MFRTVASLVVVAQGLNLEARCNPQTKIKLGGAEVEVADGKCVNVGNDKHAEIEFCGSGELTLSRMTCEKHDYKSMVINHAKTDYTDQCESISAAGTNVEGWLGSYSIKC